MKSLEELQALRDQMKDQMGIRHDAKDNIRVVVGMATCGIAAGAFFILHIFMTPNAVTSASPRFPTIRAVSPRPSLRP